MLISICQFSITARNFRLQEANHFLQLVGQRLMVVQLRELARSVLINPQHCIYSEYLGKLMVPNQSSDCGGPVSRQKRKSTRTPIL